MSASDYSPTWAPPCPDCGTTRHLHGTRYDEHLKREVPLWQCWRCAYDGQRMRLEKIEACWAERDARAAELEAVVQRVRAKCTAWSDEAKRTSNLLPRDRTERQEGYAEAQDDCADEVLVVLPKEPST